MSSLVEHDTVSTVQSTTLNKKYPEALFFFSKIFCIKKRSSGGFGTPFD